MLYVAKSFKFIGIQTANNSLIVHYPSTCPSCFIEFYCFSNSTLSEVGEIVFPDGNAYSDDITQNSKYVVETEDYATLHVQLLDSTRDYSGIFTCKLPDSYGNTIEISVGIYADFSG